jgi:hypothetical protein
MSTPENKGSLEASMSLPNQAFEQPAKRARASRAKPKAAATVEDIPREANEKLYKVVLHDSKEIPPNGQMIGVNGKQYFMKPGVVYNVPKTVLEVLNHAIHGLPDVDENMQVVGVRQAPRLPYTLHPD